MTNQPKIPWWKINLSNQEAQMAKEAILKRHITQGKLTQKFESILSKRLKIPYVVLTTSGSAGILMSLMACGFNSNDEIILPNTDNISDIGA